MKSTHQLMTLLLFIGICSTPSCAKKQLAPGVLSPPVTVAKEVVAPPAPPVLTQVEEAAPQEKEEGTERFTQVTIPFGYDSHVLAPHAMDLLKEKQAWLASHPDIFILIEGHCDIRGTDAYNLNLGKKRALAVRDALVNLGVPGQRMSWISMGESSPMDSGQTEAAHGKNRRVQFRIKAGE